MSDDAETRKQEYEAKAEEIHPLEAEMEEYPLRDASEDPRWALRTVRTWVGIMIFLLLFIVYLTIAGIWYD